MWLSMFGVVEALVIFLAGVAVAQVSSDSVDSKRQPAHPRLDIEHFMKDYDKNGDGFLQKEEAPPYLRDHFAEVDANKDGKLSREELERSHTYLQPRRRPSDMVFILIETSDCDAGCTDEIQRVYDVLRKVDKDHNGKIDAKELAEMRLTLVQDRTDHIMQELDANKDGRLSLDEARGPIKSNFTTIDRNRDGYIDRSELLQAASERHSPKKEN